jgi:tetratricopeptide (TPR) repeat protein
MRRALKKAAGACRRRIAARFDATCTRLVEIAFSRSPLRPLTDRILARPRRQAPETPARTAGSDAPIRRWTALHLIKSASLARRRDQQARAIDLLVKAIALAPQVPEPLLALGTLLDDSFRFLQAETRIAEGIRLCPSSIGLRLMLAQVQFQRRHLDDALDTVDALLAMAPDCARAWCEYGRILSISLERLGMADKAFERAGELCGNDRVALEWIAQHFLNNLDYQRAARYYERLFVSVPEAFDDPVLCRNYARCLRKEGRPAQARRVLEKALESCQSTARRKSGEDLALDVRERGLLFFEAGQADDAATEWRKAAGIAGPAPDFERAEYLPATPTRLQRISDVIGGRDLFVMLQGPSFADFAARADEFASFDFAVATMNSFPPVEEELVRRVGREVDLLLISHPGTIQAWHDELEHFLSRPSRNLLATTRYALSGLEEFDTDQDAFIKRHDERLLIFEPHGGPPIPPRPLHFESGSPTVALLIPLLLFGKPRRVFLFGADGGAHPKFEKRAYFFHDDHDAKGPPQTFLNRPDMVSFKDNPDRLHEANRRLRVNAVNADRIMATALRTLEMTVGLAVPPIFNVCPHSAHELFPRIGIDAALSILRSDPAHAADSTRVARR